MYDSTDSPHLDPIFLNKSLTFECQLDDDIVNPPLEKQKMLLAACYGVVPTFDVSAAPYKLQKQNFLPTAKILKQEMLCRTPNIKVRGKRNTELVEFCVR